MRKYGIFLILILAFTLLLVGCQDQQYENSDTPSEVSAEVSDTVSEEQSGGVYDTSDDESDVSGETSLPAQEISDEASENSVEVSGEHTHQFASAWSYDKSSHWYACECGEKSGTESHTFGEWRVTAEATCASKGSKERSCTLCGYVSEESISAAAHKYTYEITFPTFTEQGYTTHTCTKCGDQYIDSYTEPTGSNVQFGGVKYVETMTLAISVRKEYPAPETVVIPEKFEGYTVTAIADSAFQEVSGVKTVIIPNTVTAIDLYAFSWCPDLENVVLGKSITEIKPGAFESSEKIKYNIYDNGCYLGTEDNPYYALIKAKDIDITSCVIHPDTRVIAGDAFRECHNLESLTIPDKVTEIPISFAINCFKLSSVTLNNNITRINESAFAYCASLEKIDLPDSLTNIRFNAFYGCTSLTTVTLPKNIKSIGDEAFGACTNLKFNVYNNAYYLGTKDNPYFALIKAQDRSIKSCETHNDTKMIADMAFLRCEYLENVSIGNNVTVIGSGAFWRCTKLSEIVIPDSVLRLGESAFMECEGLKKVKIGNGITVLESRTFESCTSLSDVTLGNSITVIDSYAFYKCLVKMDILLPESVTELKANAFRHSSIKSINIPDSVTKIGAAAFYGTYLTEITLGNGITAINYATFSGCEQLETVTIPSGVVFIGEDAFKDCPLTDVYYKGTEQQWKQIERDYYYDDGLRGANVTIHFEG